MFSYDKLVLPIVGAPMAGGPSTPELAAAVSEAGGLGMLAGGYLTAEQLSQQIASTRALTRRDFGVNLFVPEPPPEHIQDARAQLTEFERALAPLARQLGADPGSARCDAAAEYTEYEALLATVIEARPACVTFTFGCPTAEVISRVKRGGSLVGVTVTHAADAQGAADAGADFLCVQGPAAGGHQSTFSVNDRPNQLPLTELLYAVRRITGLPLVAAGGVRTGIQVQALLAAGAAAVQLGTPLLLAQEAGTNATHRALLAAPERLTLLTRSFTGRYARAISNEWVTQFEGLAPALYPGVHEVTAPLRRAAAAAGQMEWIHAWAGENYGSITSGPAAQILRSFS